MLQSAITNLDKTIDRRINSINRCILGHRMPELYGQLDNIVNECAANFSRLKRFDLDCHHADGDDKCFVKPVLGNESLGALTDRQTNVQYTYFLVSDWYVCTYVVLYYVRIQ